MDRTCASCGEAKDLTQFSRRARPRPGISSVCKICDAARAAEWRRNNPEKRRASIARYKAQFPDRVRESTRRWAEKNADYKRAASREWSRLNRPKLLAARIKNKEAILEGNRLREDMIRSATPTWLTRFHKHEILIVYMLAQAMTDVHGKRYAVDHIMPLKGKNSCGLHVPWNLRVIDGRTNAQKKNSLPDLEWHLAADDHAGHPLPDGSFFVPPHIVEALGEGVPEKGRAVLDELVAISRRQMGKTPRSPNKRGRL